MNAITRSPNQESPTTTPAAASPGPESSVSTPQTSGNAAPASISTNAEDVGITVTPASSSISDPMSLSNQPGSASNTFVESSTQPTSAVITSISDSIPAEVPTFAVNSTRILSSRSSTLAPSSKSVLAPTSPVATALPTDDEDAIASSTSNLSPRVVAGISVATGVAGAIIAAGIVFFLLRRRRRRRASVVGHERLDSYQDHSDTFSGSTAIAILEKPDPSSSNGSGKDIVDLLPPASDFELQSDFTTLSASIRSYVETYCTASSELSSLAQDHNIHKQSIEGLPELLSPSCPLSERQLDGLLKDPSTRLAAIRFLIAWNILSNVRPDAPLATTLLPPEISRCLEALEPIPLGSVTARPASPFRCPSPSSMRIVSEAASSSEDWLMSLHTWRRVTGAAMAAIYSDGVEQQLDFRDSRKGNISELTASLICVLQPFVVKGKGAVRVKELERVVMRGAQVGWKLFGQGSTWNFGWKDSEGEGRFAVFPSLVKVGDEEGKRLGRPVVVAECEEAEGL